MAFEVHSFYGLGKRGALTVSVGVGTYRSGMEINAKDLVDLADKALYAAKRGGRNRVEISHLNMEYSGGDGFSVICGEKGDL